MRRSTTLLLTLRTLAGAAALLACAPHSAVAQSYAVKTPSAVLATPNGTAIGSVRPGVEVRILGTRGAYARVALSGYVERARLSSQRGSSTTRVGGKAATLRASAATSARTLGSFDAGTIVYPSRTSAPKGWVKVTREGWVLRSALERSDPPAVASRPKAEPRGRAVASAPKATAPKASAPKASAAKAAAPKTTASKATASKESGAKTASQRASTGEVEAPAPAGSGPVRAPVEAAPTPAPAPVASAPEPLSDSALVPTANIPLRAAPDARPVATIAQGTTLVPLARERGWVKVRVEGWVPERDVAPADSTVRSNVSAADLRADPQGSRGMVVRWSVQVLATQKADGLRRDMSPNETYLLARGPFDENALLYLVVPPSLLSTTNAIPELSQATITARVRTGKSDLVGVPILDLLTIAVQK